MRTLLRRCTGLALGTLFVVSAANAQTAPVEPYESDTPFQAQNQIDALVKRRSDGVALVIKTDATLAKAGADNLIVGVFMERAESQQSDAKTPRRQNRRLALGVLPAIPIEIVTP